MPQQKRKASDSQIIDSNLQSDYAVSQAEDDTTHSIVNSNLLVVYFGMSKFAALHFDQNFGILQIIEPFTEFEKFLQLLEQYDDSRIVCNGKIKVKLQGLQAHDKIEVKSFKEFQKSIGETFFNDFIAELNEDHSKVKDLICQIMVWDEFPLLVGLHFTKLK